MAVLPNLIEFQGLKSLCENSNSPCFCSARLQAGTLESSTCPPEGGRYMNQNRVLTQTLRGFMRKNPMCAILGVPILLVCICQGGPSHDRLGRGKIQSRKAGFRV